MIRQPLRGLLTKAIFCVAFFVVYYLLNLPQVIFMTQLGFTSWYPAAGVSAGTLLGLSPWYGLLVLFTDPVVGRLIYGTHIFSWGGLGGSLGPAGFYAMAAVILRGPWKIDVSLRRRQDVLRYLVVSLAAGAGSTSIGVGALLLNHTLKLQQYWTSWLSWYGGETIGVIGVAPFLLIHVLPTARRYLEPQARKRAEEEDHSGPKRSVTGMAVAMEFAAQIAAIPATLYCVLTRPTAMGHPLFLAFLPIIWIAIRKGVRRVVTGNIVLITAMLLGLRIFPISADSLFATSLALLLILTMGLTVGSSVSEQYRQARELRNQTVYLNSLVENSPLATVFLGLDKKMRLCNEAFLRMFQYSLEDLAMTTVDRLLWPPELEEEGEKMFTDVKAGRTLRVPTRQQRKDGTLLDVELIAVPLVVDGRSRGVCWIYSDISERLHAAEEAQRHSEQLNRMVQELQIHNTEMMLLAELNGLLQCCATSQEADEAVAHSAHKLFPAANAGILYRYNPDHKVLESVARWGDAGGSEPAFEPASCWGFRRGRAHWSDQPGGGVVCAHLKDPVEASYLCVPMTTGNQTAGLLRLRVDRGGRERELPAFVSMMEGMERLAVTAAGQIALAMVSLKMREKLQNLSAHDPLTGLYNRRTLEATLEREFSRARRKKHPLAVAFIDLDHFKTFNDTFGHAAGDEILMQMARTFREFYRGEDIVCRYGGEEFAVVMPEARAADAAARAEQLRARAEKMVVSFQGRTFDRLTLSIGVAAYPDHASNAAALLRVADECLYRSKTAGRNRVTLARKARELAPSAVPASGQMP